MEEAADRARSLPSKALVLLGNDEQRNARKIDVQSARRSDDPEHSALACGAAKDNAHPLTVLEQRAKRGDRAAAGAGRRGGSGVADEDIGEHAARRIAIQTHLFGFHRLIQLVQIARCAR